MKRFVGIIMATAALATGAERLYFNDLEAPESLKDLANIETALKSSLPKARAATVCLELGPEKGSGSGVIISEDGLILSAAHVTGGVGRHIEAVMEDGTRYPVKTLGLISTSDAALAKIEGEGPFPYVEMDKELGTRLGDWVMSLGHSGGFDKDRGLVVRLGRIVRMANRTWQSDGTLIGGDSGGPLFNLRGQLIGIHSRVGQTKGENMHVPLEEFLDNWDVMMSEKFVGEGPFAQRLKGRLGIRLEDDSTVIREVVEESPAARAGLEEGDVILSADGTEIEDIEQLKAVVTARYEGERIQVAYRREGEERTTEVQLGGLEEKMPQLPFSMPKEDSGEEDSEGDEPEEADEQDESSETSPEEPSTETPGEVAPEAANDQES
ncbi:MAG: trypsin-like peptidase domain-containing protein [Verrucomicrobiota bacterium JB023]|nr:trypsin-like peptidase domain-containing protein [Verrucomicrobiota bacterium JB023]